MKVFLLGKETSVNNPSSPKSLFTGEPVVNSNKSIKSAIYVSNESPELLYGISDADLVFEYLNTNGKVYYNAIFHDHIPDRIYPVVDLKEGDAVALPKLHFSPSKGVSENWTKSSNYVFINFTPNLSSNFIYNNEKYFHYRNTSKDIDSNNNSHIAVANIIIQFIDKKNLDGGIGSIEGSGTGLAFSNGRGIEIKWNRKDKGPIEILDNYNKPISLTPGHTWWIIADKSCTVVYK